MANARQLFLKFSHLSDDEFLRYLLMKPNPTDEDIESAVRIEHMLESYRELLERIHALACAETDPRAQLQTIRTLTAPAGKAVTLQ